MKSHSKINNQVSLFRPLLDTQKQFLIKISKTIFEKYFKPLHAFTTKVI